MRNGPLKLILPFYQSNSLLWRGYFHCTILKSDVKKIANFLQVFFRVIRYLERQLFVVLLQSFPYFCTKLVSNFSKLGNFAGLTRFINQWYSLLKRSAVIHRFLIFFRLFFSWQASEGEHANSNVSTFLGVAYTIVEGLLFLERIPISWQSWANEISLAIAA